MSERRERRQARPELDAMNATRFLAAGSLVVLALGYATAAAATSSSVYKCRQAGGGVLYRSVPCEGGERLDLDVQPPDPAAAERLARDRESLAMSAELRRAKEVRDEAEAKLAAERRNDESSLAARDAAPGDYPEYAGIAGDYGYGYGYGYGDGSRGRGSRGRSKAHRQTLHPHRTIQVPPPVFRPHRG
jgi:hypothetical protein